MCDTGSIFGRLYINMKLEDESIGWKYPHKRESKGVGVKYTTERMDEWNTVEDVEERSNPTWAKSISWTYSSAAQQRTISVSSCQTDIKVSRLWREFKPSIQPAEQHDVDLTQSAEQHDIESEVFWGCQTIWESCNLEQSFNISEESNCYSMYLNYRLL